MRRLFALRTLRGAAVVAASHRPATTAAAAPPPTIGQSMAGRGFTTSTPSFNVDFANLPDDPDLGDIESRPATGVQLARDLQGPWLVMCSALQGELFVEADGYVFFRPSGNLGHGVGRMTLSQTAAGLVTFRLVLESYVYPNTAAHPPHAPSVVDVQGMVAVASSAKKGYQTFTLVGNGTARQGDAGSVPTPNRAAATAALPPLGAAGTEPFNAAKLTPWDPATAAPWVPNEEIRRSFQHIFPQPLVMTSHLQRAAAASGGRLDLAPYRVGDVSDVFYIPNYVSADEERQMLDQLARTPKEVKSQLTKRTVQEWGCTMCPTCSQSFVADVNLPPWMESVSDALVHDGIFSPSIFPNNVRVHEYVAGEGIAPHVDGPIYVPIVAILSLGSTSVMGFYPRREPHAQPMEHYNDTFRFDGEIGSQRPHMSVVLEPRSLVIFRGEAFTHYPHGISDKLVDSLAEDVAGPVVNRHLLSDPQVREVVRKYRVGVTVRNLLPRCNHQPRRAEYAMRRAWDVFHRQPLTSSPVPVAVPPAPTQQQPQAPRMPTFAAPPPPPPAQPAAPAVAAPAVGGDVAALHAKLDVVIAEQKALSAAVKDLRGQLLASAAANATFRKEVSSVLNYLSATVLKVDSSVEELVDAAGTDAAGARK